MHLPIIDRRLSPGGKNLGNVERFRRRYRDHLRDAAERALVHGNGTLPDGTDVHIPQRDMAQPIFRHSTSGGKQEYVHPGNKEYYKGDRIARPPEPFGKGGGGGGGGDGDDHDNFVYHLDKKALLEILLDDLELPNMAKRALLSDEEFYYRRAGIVTSGSPNNLHVLRSFRKAVGRRIALDGPNKRAISALEERLLSTEVEDERTKICDDLAILRGKPKAAYIDPIDLLYRNRVRVAVPQHKAVIFRLMDASGSMGEDEKSNAKLFNILLRMFIEKEYDHVEIVNIRYHDRAYICDDQTFYFGTDTGGTTVSNALGLMLETIKKNYPLAEWNVYGSLASDGDTGTRYDRQQIESLFPGLAEMCQHFFYLELSEDEEELGDMLEDMFENNPNFSMQRNVTRKNLVRAFRSFFEKRGFTQDRHSMAALSSPRP